MYTCATAGPAVVPTSNAPHGAGPIALAAIASQPKPLPEWTHLRRSVQLAARSELIQVAGHSAGWSISCIVCCCCLCRPRALTLSVWAVLAGLLRIIGSPLGLAGQGGAGAAWKSIVTAMWGMLPSWWAGLIVAGLGIITFALIHAGASLAVVPGQRPTLALARFLTTYAGALVGGLSNEVELLEEQERMRSRMGRQLLMQRGG